MSPSNTLIIASALLVGVFVGVRITLVITRWATPPACERNATPQGRETMVEVLALINALSAGTARREERRGNRGRSKSSRKRR